MVPKVYQYKLVLLGESAVGKSSLVLRFVRNVFASNQESTIGAAFLTQTLQHGDDSMKFEIWDTAGQERYHSLAPMYYRGAHAAVIVYDITNMESFERAKKWVQELQKQAQPNIVIALVGNKLDLDTEGGSNRQVPIETAEKYAEEENLLLMETSAKTGTNVAEMFDRVAGRMPKTEAQLASSRAFGSGSRLDLNRAGQEAADNTRSCC